MVTVGTSASMLRRLAMNSDMKNEVEVMGLTIVVLITLIACHYLLSRGSSKSLKEIEGRSKSTSLQPSEISSCKNVHCIRCQRYRYVQERAQSRLSWILWDLKQRDQSNLSRLNRRIPNAVLQACPNSISHRNTCSNGENIKNHSSLQAPNILMIFDLPSREIVTDWHQEACAYLEKCQTRTIVNEALKSLGYGNICAETDGGDWSDHQTFSTVEPNADCKWTVNDSQGVWKVFHVLNQGVWNPSLICDEVNNTNDKEPCRKLLQMVRNIPGLLNNCLFGNVFISKIYPGTNIEPHCGPTNIRHRLQFLLKLPNVSSVSSSVVNHDSRNCNIGKVPRLFMSVGCEKKILWTIQNNTFVFDDSYVHSVIYRNQESSRNGYTNIAAPNQERKNTRNQDYQDSLARVVLIVDLWHPALQQIEMKLLQDLYPPYKPSCTH